MSEPEQREHVVEAILELLGADDATAAVIRDAFRKAAEVQCLRERIMALEEALRGVMPICIGAATRTGDVSPRGIAAIKRAKLLLPAQEDGSDG